MSGFFKLHYDITKWEHWHDPKILVVWVHLLARARWDKKPMRYKGVLVERGQCLIERKEFAKDCGLSIQSVRRCIETLKSTSEITTKTTNKGAVVTIEKYAFWQDKFVETTTETTSKPTNEQPPNNHPATTQQPLNNKVYKDNNPYKDNKQLEEDARAKGLNMDMWKGLRNKEWA